MPNYKYKCTVCDHEFDTFQRITSKPLTKCPKCNGKLRKIISGGVGVIFKGSGFYENDYKKKSTSTSKHSTINIKKTNKNSETKKSKTKEKSIDNSKKVNE